MKLKSFFLARKFSEKILIICAILLPVVVFWVPSLFSHTRDLLAQKQKAATDLLTQQEWLDRDLEIKGLEQEAVASIRSGTNYTVTSLQAAIMQMATNAEIPLTSLAYPSQRQKNTNVMSIIMKRVTLTSIEMSNLVAFYREVAKRAPDIVITAVRIDAARGRGAGGGGGGGAAGLATDPTAGGGRRGGAATTVGNLGNGVTDTFGGAAGAAGGGRRGGGLATDLTVGGGGGGGRAVANVPAGSRLNVTLDLTTVSLVTPGTPTTTAPATGTKPAGTAPAAPAGAPRPAVPAAAPAAAPKAA